MVVCYSRERDDQGKGRMHRVACVSKLHEETASLNRNASPVINGGSFELAKLSMGCGIIS